jgi:Cu/Ag efflux protein CusF
MKTRWIPLLVIVALVGWVGAVSAQTTAPAPAATPPAAAAEKMVEGKVKAVDQAKKQVTLEDGTTLTFPAGLQVEWTQIKAGSTMSASYVEAGQLKNVRKYEIKS